MQWEARYSQKSSLKMKMRTGMIMPIVIRYLQVTIPFKVILIPMDRQQATLLTYQASRNLKTLKISSNQ